EPSKQMETEAASAGFFTHETKRYPRLQILTIKELLDGKRPQVPLIDSSVYKRAAREDDSESRQGLLDFSAPKKRPRAAPQQAPATSVKRSKPLRKKKHKTRPRRKSLR